MLHVPGAHGTTASAPVGQYVPGTHPCDVGIIVGDAVGDTLGAMDGDAVGDALGLSDGDALGRGVGETDGDALGSELGDAVGDILGDVVGARVHSREPDPLAYDCPLGCKYASQPIPALVCLQQVVYLPVCSPSSSKDGTIPTQGTGSP